MRKGQLSIDFLFAVTLIMLTVISLISFATSEVEGTRTFDTASKLKVFSIDMRDTITKVYSAGDGFSIRKESPIELSKGEYIKVTLNSTTNTLNILAKVDGKTYRTTQKIPIRIVADSTVKLTRSTDHLWITCHYNETIGGIDVRISKNP